MPPVYEFLCECGYTTEKYRQIEQRNDAPVHCGRAMERLISPSMVNTDIQPYRAMATGEMITSRAKHREYLKRNGLIEVGNEVKHVLSPKKTKLSKESRKRRIAEVLNNR